MFYCHHALYDAWSMPRLVTELASLYTGVICVKDAPCFTQLVRHTVESLNADEERAFWKETLSSCEKALIPCAGPSPSGLSRKQTFLMAQSTSIAVSDLETLCNTHRISPHHILLLAFARALAKETDTTSPLFGFFQLGRSAAFDGIENVTGPCVNALPLGISSPLTQPVLESSRNVQALLGARVPFEQSRLRDAVEAFDDTAATLPFNAYINILWNAKSLIGEVRDDDLFQPMAIGVPTDYSSEVALEGTTAVDGLDTSFLSDGSLFMDIGRGENSVVFGVRADAKLMGEQDLNKFIRGVEGQIEECLVALGGV